MNAMRGATVLAWVAAVSMAACSAGDGTRRAEPEPSVPEAEASQAPRPPLELQLDGTQRPDGSLVLVATIHLAAGLIAPPVVRLVLPEGAVLASGYPEEVLSAPGREVTYRREYVVRGAGGPIRVVAQSIGVARGVRVEARWPQPEAAVSAPAVRTQPIPPTPIDGVRVDQAVPLDPGR